LALLIATRRAGIESEDLRDEELIRRADAMAYMYIRRYGKGIERREELSLSRLVVEERWNFRKERII